MTYRWSGYTKCVYLMICILVDVIHGLRFAIEPEDQIAVISTPLWWDCSAIDVDNVSYRWSFNNNPLPDHGNLIVFGNGTLHIRKISADDVGVYKCTAETSGGGQIVTSREATLQLAYIDASFTLEPQAQTVLLGDTVTLVCKIGSLPMAEITWLLNGEVVILGTATQGPDGESTLVLSTIMYYGAGEYKCKVTNPLVQVYRYSLGANLVVRGTPVFLASLEGVSVPEGFNASFNCYFHGNPEPSLTWFSHTTTQDGQVSTRELKNDNKTHINPNGTLTIYNVNDADEAFYTCSVENVFGQMSESAILNVTGEVTLPEFTVTPQNVTVELGQDVTLYCEASGNPVPVISWLRDNVELLPSDGIKMRNGQLTIVSIQPGQSGGYTCRAENGGGTVNSLVYINVQVIPSFTLSPIDTISVIGDMFVLHCKAEGNPAPRIVWSTPQYGDLGMTSSFPRLTVHSNSTLVVSSAAYTDAGIYTCTARNAVGYKQASATVKIESPPEFTLLPISQSVNQGGTVYFHCQSSGVPTPTFIWSKDGEGFITSSSQKQIYLNHTLALRSVDQSDAGVYRCTVSNRHGTILAVATLTVTVPPSFTVDPKNQTVYIGSKVDLYCDSKGEPVPTQSWRKDGRYLYSGDNIIVSADGSHVSIDAITENQFGEYTCVSANLAGTRSVSAWIHQYDVPVITLYPRNTTVNQSESLTLQCKGEVKTGAPSVVWYREIAGEIIRVEPNNRVTVTDIGDLRIKTVESSDEGWYRCVLSNSAGAVSAQLFVNVNELPRILHTNSPQTTIHQSTVTLTCQSTGDPPPTLEWIRPSGTKVKTSSDYLIGDDSLEIVSANQNKDEGDWKCRSCNIVGCVDQSITLHVDGLPLIDSFHAYKSGLKVKLECKVKGQPLPGITFTSQGQTVTGGLQGHSIQNNVLTIRQADVRAEYTCRAANKYGHDSVSLTVPGQTQAPSVVTIAPSWVTLLWTQPDNMSDLPLTSYQVQMTSNGGRTWQNVPVSEDLTSKSRNVSSLRPYMEYNFRVAAENVLGVGRFSDLSAEVLTLADAPSPPTNVAAIEIDGGSVLFSWSPSQFINGDRVDVAYQYTITVDNSDTFYMSDTVYYNGTLQAEVLDISSPGLYVFTVKAVNLKIRSSSESVRITMDLTTPSSQAQTTVGSPKKIIIILAGVIGGIILVLVIIFIGLRVRRSRKTESLSFLKPRLSLDQFYMENSKHLYSSESRLSMKRSRSGNSFYSFTNDDSFHGNGLSVKDNNSGYSSSKRKSDGDVLLVAKNPLYAETAMSVSAQSSRVTSPEPLLFDSLEQSYSLQEIELPSTDMVTTGSRPNSLNCGKTGSPPINLNCGKLGSQQTGSENSAKEDNKTKKPLTPLSAENLEDDINAIYNSMKSPDKPSSEKSLEHVYASIHSDGQSSRSKDFSMSSDNSQSSDPNQPKPPTRVLSPNKLRPSPLGDHMTNSSIRSDSPRRSRSISPIVDSEPKPPTRVLSVGKLRVTPENDVTHFTEGVNHNTDEIKQSNDDDIIHKSDVTTHATNGITHNKDDTSNQPDEITHNTNDITNQINDVMHEPDDIIHKNGDITHNTDDTCTEYEDINVNNKNTESSASVIPFKEASGENTPDIDKTVDIKDDIPLKELSIHNVSNVGNTTGIKDEIPLKELSIPNASNIGNTSDILVDNEIPLKELSMHKTPNISNTTDMNDEIPLKELSIHNTSNINNTTGKHVNDEKGENKPLKNPSVDITSDLNNTADINDDNIEDNVEDGIDTYSISNSSHNNSVEDGEEVVDDADMFLPESEGAGEFLLVVKETRKDPWRSKMEDNFLTDEQIKEELISAELY